MAVSMNVICWGSDTIRLSRDEPDILRPSCAPHNITTIPHDPDVFTVWKLGIETLFQVLFALCSRVADICYKPNYVNHHFRKNLKKPLCLFRNAFHVINTSIQWRAELDICTEINYDIWKMIKSRFSGDVIINQFLKGEVPLMRITGDGEFGGQV